MANIKDIARLSGVAPTTVSAVLNGRKHLVAEATRERILKVMQELRYVPGPLFYGDRYNDNMSTTLAVLYMFEEGEPDPYYLTLLAGMIEQCASDFINLLSIRVHNWTNAFAEVRKHIDGRCDGIITIISDYPEDLLQALTARRIPIATVNMEREMPDLNSISSDIYAGATMALQHLYDLGHRRIAALTAEVHPDLRGNAYTDFAKSHEMPYCEKNVLRTEWNRASGYECAKKILQRTSNRPTALFCYNDQIAMGALSACRDLGLDVPGDISITGFDDLPEASVSQPALTTVSRSLKRVGMEAVTLLKRHLNDPSIPSGEHIQLPIKLIVRESTGIAPD